MGKYARARQVGTDGGGRVSESVISRQQTFFILFRDIDLIGHFGVLPSSARDSLFHESCPEDAKRADAAHGTVECSA